MDALDRTFRHLLQTIQTRYPAYLTQPFEVAELYQNILPYRHHRRELGLETNQDYELVLLQLLSGARDYLVVNDEMRERLARELASPNPDPGAFREFSTSQIALSPAAVRRFETGGDRLGARTGRRGRVSATETTERMTTQRRRAHRSRRSRRRRHERSHRPPPRRTPCRATGAASFRASTPRAGDHRPREPRLRPE